PSSRQLTGIHHLTAITAKTTTNHTFYTGTLGLRLVKKTVNQDDTSAYHLFYADGLASPGSDLTFFDWPMPPDRRATHSIARTGPRRHDGPRRTRRPAPPRRRARRPAPHPPRRPRPPRRLPPPNLRRIRPVRPSPRRNPPPHHRPRPPLLLQGPLPPRPQRHP